MDSTGFCSGSNSVLQRKWIVSMLKRKGGTHQNRGILRISLSAEEKE
jgi:hypothetical protein